MKINRHSIFLKLNLLFFITVVSITIIFFIFFSINKHRELGIIIGDSRQVTRIVRAITKHNPKELPIILNEEGYNLVKDKSGILKLAKPIKYPKKLPPPLKRKLQNKRLQILELNSKIYFYINLPKHKLLIQNRSYPDRTYWIVIAYLAIIFILFFLYMALKNALTPIKKLEYEIKKFSNGNLDIDTKSKRKDEIASVGNQFYDAVQKIQKLQDSRTLFLRNIMHELKTPITKGKIALSLMDKNEQKSMLDKVLNKIDSLVNEMAEIEQITAGNITLDKNNYKLIDIVDEAIDLLYLKKEDVLHNITDQILFCDFKLFKIVMKNLIDNGIKYSLDHKVQIKVDSNSIQFINQSSPLKHEFKHYLEPFFKGELRKSNQSGFGLGLYITNQIIQLHEFTLEYKHEVGNNILTIIYK